MVKAIAALIGKVLSIMCVEIMQDRNLKKLDYNRMDKFGISEKLNSCYENHSKQLYYK